MLQNWKKRVLEFIFLEPQQTQTQTQNQTITHESTTANLPLFSPAPGPSPSSLSPAVTAKLQQKYESIRTKYKLPALAGGADTDKGTLYVCAGVRKVGTNDAIQHNDLFHLGSCTKAMTATLVAIFVDRGLLSWDSTLSVLFPEMHNMHHQYKNVPIKMLTAHRSGISGDCLGFDNGKLWKALWSLYSRPTEGRALTARQMLTKPPAYPPNTKNEYSNYNYIIIGAILERLTGKAWEQIIQEELFRPLGMTSCGFGPQALNGAKQPWPHKENESSIISFVYPDHNADNPPPLGPAGTVHCSLNDWLKFIRFHIDGFNGRPTPLLSPAAFSILHKQFPGTDHTSGGWINVNRSWAGGTTLTHQGSNTMNHAVVWVAPKKRMSFVVACNVGCPNAAKACDEAVVALLEAVGAL